MHSRDAYKKSFFINSYLLINLFRFSLSPMGSSFQGAKLNKKNETPIKMFHYFLNKDNFN